MPDELPARRDDLVPATEDVIPVKELDRGTFSGTDWRLILSEDGWYLRQSDQAPQRVTVGDAVRQIGKYGRAPVFRATREYVADIGRELGDNAYLSPTAEPPSLGERQMRDRGLDPKLPSDQIAKAGHIIGRLGDELAEAEAASPIV
jgi:hypothetical protein